MRTMYSTDSEHITLLHHFKCYYAEFTFHRLFVSMRRALEQENHQATSVTKGHYITSRTCIKRCP